MKHYYNLQGLPQEERALLEGIARAYDSHTNCYCVVDLELSLVRFMSYAMFQSLEIQATTEVAIEANFIKAYLDDEPYERLRKSQRSALSYLGRCKQSDSNLNLADYRFTCELQLNTPSSQQIYTYVASPVLLRPRQGRIRWAGILLTPSSYHHVGTTSLRRLGDYAKYIRERSYGVWEEKQGYVPSSRERLILQLTVQGHKEQAIAELLGLSMPRLKQIKQEMYRKTHTQCMVQLVARTKDWKII